MKTKITQLLGIEAPVLQGGMAWVANGALAGAVSKAGGLGLIGAGSMKADHLRKEIAIARSITDKPFGVNIMMMTPELADIVPLCIDERIPVITTGAGNPGPYIPAWKQAGSKVIPVVSSVALALRMQRAGADAVVAEGMEAGGHIGELTTFCLLPQVADAVDIPVIAAGGIADGRGMAAALMLGADGVQMGTAFICARECTVHPAYKNLILEAGDTATVVTGRGLGHPARSLKSRFIRRMLRMEKENLPPEELEEALLGSLRRAVLEGDLEQGSFMAGQISGLIQEIRPAAEIIRSVVGEAQALCGNLPAALRERGIILE